MKGSSMALFCVNCLEFPLVLLAVWKLGGHVTLVNSLLTADEAYREITRTKSEFLFCDNGQVEKVREILTKASLKAAFTRNPATGFITLNALTNIGDEHTTDLPALDGDFWDEPAVIAFSSGTTGLPKGVVLTHKNLVSKLHTWRNGVKKNQTLLSGYSNVVLYQPMSHLYGFSIIMQCMFIGETAIVMPKFDLQIFLKLNETYQCSTLTLVPPLAVLLVNNKALVQQHNLSNIQVIHCGAAPLSLEVERELLKIIPSAGSIIAQGYGMTETTAGICSTPSLKYMKQIGGPDRMHHIGVPYPNTLMKIIDPVTGTSLPPGERGEICVKGPMVMKGYLNDEEATLRTLDMEGWLHTGDIGFHDQRGYIYLVDRLKELIKYKAHQVAPSELEDLLLSHPEVSDAAVVGIPDKEAGELPAACVVLKPGCDLSQWEIQQYVSGKVAPFKKLRGGVTFLTQIPKSSSGKILRRLVLQQLMKKMSKM